MADDFHFAELAKAVKSNTHLIFSDVIDWYTEHYMTVRKNDPLYYSESLRLILINYIERHKFESMSEMVKRLDPTSWVRCKFNDLEAEVNDTYNMRVIAECCGIIRLLKVDRIPGYEV